MASFHGHLLSESVANTRIVPHGTMNETGPARFRSTVRILQYCTQITMDLRRDTWNRADCYAERCDCTVQQQALEVPQGRVSRAARP